MAEKLDDRIAHGCAAALGLDRGERVLRADAERHHAHGLILQALAQLRLAHGEAAGFKRAERLCRLFAAKLIERAALDLLGAEHGAQQRFLKGIRRDGRERVLRADLAVHMPQLAVPEPHAAG